MLQWISINFHHKNPSIKTLLILKMLLFYWKEKKKSCCTRRWGSYTLMKRETEAELKDAHPSWSMRSMLKEGCASWSSAEVSLFFSVCCSTWGAAYFLLRFSVKQYFFNCSFLLLVNKYKKIYHPCEQGSKKFSSKIMNNTSNRESAESWKRFLFGLTTLKSLFYFSKTFARFLNGYG